MPARVSYLPSQGGMRWNVESNAMPAAVASRPSTPVAPMTELSSDALTARPWPFYGRVLVYAERQPAGTWAAWVEFVSASGEAGGADGPRDDAEHAAGRRLLGDGPAVGVLRRGARPRPAARSGGERDHRPHAVSGRGGMVSFRVRSRRPAGHLPADGGPLPWCPECAARCGRGRRKGPHLRADGRARAHRDAAHLRVPRPLSSARARPRCWPQRLETDLRGTAATLEIRRVDVPIGRARHPDRAGASAGGPEGPGRDRPGVRRATLLLRRRS